MPKHTRTVKSSARPMRPSSTLMQPSCLRPARCVVGPLSNTPPRCAMCAGPQPTTAVCANSCMLASRSLPRWDTRYLDLLEANEAVIAKNVTENLFDRHIAPVFLGP